jgi:hypothetical protein
MSAAGGSAHTAAQRYLRVPRATTQLLTLSGAGANHSVGSRRGVLPTHLVGLPPSEYRTDGNQDVMLDGL